MANDSFGGQGGNVGTGNPYYGSGWNNFDNFLNDVNVGWGAQQPDYVDPDITGAGGEFNNWLIQRGHPTGFPEDNPSPPGEGTVNTDPAPAPVDPNAAWNDYDTALADWNDINNPQDNMSRPGQPFQPKTPKPTPPPGTDPRKPPATSSSGLDTHLADPTRQPWDSGRTTYER